MSRLGDLAEVQREVALGAAHDVGARLDPHARRRRLEHDRQRVGLLALRADARHPHAARADVARDGLPRSPAPSVLTHGGQRERGARVAAPLAEPERVGDRDDDLAGLGARAHPRAQRVQLVVVVEDHVGLALGLDRVGGRRGGRHDGGEHDRRAAEPEHAAGQCGVLPPRSSCTTCPSVRIWPSS